MGLTLYGKFERLLLEVEVAPERASGQLSACRSTWMKLHFMCLLWGLGVMTFSAGCADAPGGGAPISERDRIVFVGDSITDGHTLPLLVQQALREAGRPVPVCVNAAVAGNTAKDMRARIERDVLPRRPTLVTFNAGVNDAHHAVSLEDYSKDVTAIADRLKADGIPMLILTTTTLGPRNAAMEERLCVYNNFLRGFARERGYVLAEVFARMDEARKAGREGTESDHVHLNFDGYRAMTRAVLDALGDADVPVPEKLEVSLMPGIIQQWKMRPAAKEPPLTEETVRALKPDASWKDCTLPETEPMPHWWPEQERKRGFAQSLAKAVGEGGRYIGVAAIESPKARQVYFNTGAQLETVWLNGKRIYKSERWTGWHPGKERVPAQLGVGVNTVVIESGPAFFLSVTETNDW